jgi:prophage maintenance system killer protein
MKLRLPHKKQIKTNYETIFSIDSMLNDKIIKNH